MSRTSPLARGYIKCPECINWVKKAYKVCVFCGFDFIQAEQDQRHESMATDETGRPYQGGDFDMWNVNPDTRHYKTSLFDLAVYTLILGLGVAVFGILFLGLSLPAPIHGVIWLR